MIEIIAGVIVLILAIIGIAKLAQSRGGGGGSLDVEDAMTIASNSKKALAQALYSNNPEKMDAAMQYLQKAASISKSAISALYQKGRMTRSKVDAAMARYNLPTDDAIDYLSGLLELHRVAGTLNAQYNRGNLKPEQARNYLAAELKEQELAFKRHYAIRHAGFD